MISDRLLEFIESRGLTPFLFEKKIGVGKNSIATAIKNKKTVGSEIIGKIFNQYPELNLEWLIAGKGQMLNRILPTPTDSNVLMTSTNESTTRSKSKIPLVQKLKEPAGSYSPAWMDDNQAVDIVDVRAAANLQGVSIQEGYVEKIGVLPVPKHLIWQSRRKHHLWFPIIGDSMEPTIYIDDYVLAALVEPHEYNSIKDNYIYIISTRENGILIKRVLNRLQDRGQLYAKSDNRAYSGFNINQDDIVSIWFACARLSFKFPNEQINLFNKYVDHESRLEQLEQKIKKLSK